MYSLKTTHMHHQLDVVMLAKGRGMGCAYPDVDLLIEGDACLDIKQFRRSVRHRALFSRDILNGMSANHMWFPRTVKGSPVVAKPAACFRWVYVL